MKNKTTSPDVILVTGASSGIGKSIAEYLARQGHIVYGTSRKPELYPDSGFTMLKMDVCDAVSVEAAIGSVIQQEAKIDVLVNNAGYGIGGAIEETSPEKVEAQFNTNFFGAYRVLHRVLPQMRKQGGGLIINMSSIGGVIGLPYQGIYSASKFALEGLTEALYKELYGSGIRVVMIEPGDFKTGFTQNREIITAKDGRDRFEASRRVIEHDEQSGQSPLKIAYLVERIMNSKNPRLRYAVGAFDQKLSIILKKILPNRMFDKIIMKYYKC
jgi:NAD(P)-dependent dehydrogenase (short-subunit alcohol dehydrogenase family)